jgi:proteasome assembly chaperone (PAC2) family protein
MESDGLQIYEKPELSQPRLLLGFTGWMDGGEVSSGTVRWMVDTMEAKYFGSIESENYYVYNLPGMMEVATLSRPHTRINQGLIEAFDFPSNSFFYSEANNLILFLGKEPNINWESYADCLFSLCEQFHVKMMYFIGSVSSLVPHTREPRLFCTASSKLIRDEFQHFGVKFTNYEGPASISTYLLSCCSQLDVDMVNLVATVPAYVQGNNPKCIEAVTRRLAGMLDLSIDFNQLNLVSEEFEKKLIELLHEQPELANNITQLEEDYDNDIFNNEMSEIKKWLEQQGIRLD